MSFVLKLYHQYPQTTEQLHIRNEQRCRDGVINDFLSQYRRLLVPLLFHELTSLHPPSFQRNDFSTCTMCLPLFLYQWFSEYSASLSQNVISPFPTGSQSTEYHNHCCYVYECVDKDPKAIELFLYTMYNSFAIVDNTSKKHYCCVCFFPHIQTYKIFISWLRLHVQQVRNFQNIFAQCPNSPVT